jgi:hypothetical protein
VVNLYTTAKYAVNYPIPAVPFGAESFHSLFLHRVCEQRFAVAAGRTGQIPAGRLAIVVTLARVVARVYCCAPRMRNTFRLHPSSKLFYLIHTFYLNFYAHGKKDSFYDALLHRNVYGPAGKSAGAVCTDSK